jgi:hypothetical protein
MGGVSPIRSAQTLPGSVSGDAETTSDRQFQLVTGLGQSRLNSVKESSNKIRKVLTRYIPIWVCMGLYGGLYYGVNTMEKGDSLRSCFCGVRWAALGCVVFEFLRNCATRLPSLAVVSLASPGRPVV